MIPKERQVQPATTGPNVCEAHVEEGALEEDEETNEEVEIVESEDQQQVKEQQAENAFQLFHLPSDVSVNDGDKDDDDDSDSDYDSDRALKSHTLSVRLTQTNSILRSHAETIISHAFEIPCSFYSEVPL